MSGKRVTKEQILAELTSDMEVLAERMAAAINNAQAGAIIDQSVNFAHMIKILIVNYVYFMTRIRLCPSLIF